MSKKNGKKADGFKTMVARRIAKLGVPEGGVKFAVESGTASIKPGTAARIARPGIGAKPQAHEMLGGVGEDALVEFIRFILKKVGHEVFVVPAVKSEHALVRVLAAYDAAGINALLLITRSTRALLTQRFDAEMVALVECRLSMVV